MSTPNRTARKAAAINTAAAKARTSAGRATTKAGSSAVGDLGRRPVKPVVGKVIGSKGKAPVYEVPKPIKPKPAKK